MKFVFILLFSLIWQICYADLRLGFSQSEYQLLNIQGQLSITCESPFDGRKDYRNLNCQDTRLFPFETDYFWGPTNSADSIRLVSHHENGKSVTFVMSYDSQIGRTKKQFQLWRNLNNQQPVLNIGKNRIEYYFISKGQIVDQGEMIIQVHQQQTRLCKSKNQYSYNANDCIDVWNTCDKYLKQQNYCL